MKARCYNPNCHQYADYGGRGITVCEEWRNSSLKFMLWAIENGWQPGLQIDKDIKDGMIYNPDNCLFVTPKVNSNNKRNYKKKYDYPVGVHFDKRSKTNPWVARINIDGKMIHVGMFPTPELASEAFQKANESRASLLLQPRCYL